MIEARHLTKDFAAVRAVHDVSFRVETGEAVGFLGPNGAGKTTTFRMLAGTLGPSSGSILVNGIDLIEQPIAAKRHIGYVPEVTPLYPEMTVREYLSFRGELRGIVRAVRKQSVEASAEKAQVEHHLQTRIAHLSKGYRRRVALADGLLGDPPVLLLDEPTAGLDPNQILDVRALIRKLAQDRAILISTHVLSEIESTCSRAIVIHEGKLVAEGSLAELHEARKSKRAFVLLDSDEATARGILEATIGTHDPVYARQGKHTRCSFEATQPRLLSETVALAVRAELPVLEAGPQHAALDDVFAQLTRPKPAGRP